MSTKYIVLAVQHISTLFLSLKRTKTYLCSTMREERHNNFIFLSFNSDIALAIPMDDVVDRIATKNRRMTCDKLEYD